MTKGRQGDTKITQCTEDQPDVIHENYVETVPCFMTRKKLLIDIWILIKLWWQKSQFLRHMKKKCAYFIKHKHNFKFIFKVISTLDIAPHVLNTQSRIQHETRPKTGNM